MADVVVVGAGPAGSVAAKRLRDYGFDVSLYEKEKLPRHKHCGGYVSYKAIKDLDSMGIDCRDVLLQRIRGWAFRCANEVVSLDSGGPEDDLPGNVYREEFDHFLAKIAVESGARVVDSTKISKIVVPEKGEGACSVVSQRGREECEVILGADGAQSAVRRHLGISYPREKQAVAIEAEVPADKRAIDSCGARNLLDMDCFRVGYAWAFPKTEGKTINVGVISSVDEVRQMDKPLSATWKAFLQGQAWFENQDVHPHREIMPYMGTVDRLGYDRVLLLGDAAGLVDPVVGEGISFAIESGKNAADAVRLQSEGKASLLGAYSELMKFLLEQINEYGMKLHDFIYVENKMTALSRLRLLADAKHLGRMQESG